VRHDVPALGDEQLVRIHCESGAVGVDLGEHPPALGVEYGVRGQVDPGRRVAVVREVCGERSAVGRDQQTARTTGGGVVDVCPCVTPADLPGGRVGHHHAVGPELGHAARSTGYRTGRGNLPAPGELAVELHREYAGRHGGGGAHRVGSLEPGLDEGLSGGHDDPGEH
jgi:hypothetical protein